MSTAESKQVIFRSLDDLEETPEFRQFVAREFPEGVENPPDGVTRRRWIQLMGASAVLAGVSGCRFENKKITPYAFRPEDRVPGDTREFATTIEWAGAVRPMYVTSYDSRPIKVDGNPLHEESGGSVPRGRQAQAVASKGTSDLVSQASVLDLYDPDRSRGCLEKVGREFESRTWADFAAAVGSLDLAASGGEGFVVLSEPTTSKAVSALKDRFAAKYPKARWFDYSPVNSDNEAAGLKAAFGKSVLPQFDLSSSEVVVCLDADPLGFHASSLKNSKGWAASRVPYSARVAHRPIGRYYSIESQFTITGMNADHRWPMKSSVIGSFAESLRLQVEKVREAGNPIDPVGSAEEQRVAILANELVYGINDITPSSSGKCVVMVGANQPAEVHQVAAVINELIGSKLVSYVSVPESASNLGSIGEAVEVLDSGVVENLLLIGGNPLYDAPAELGFGSVLAKAKNKIHFSMAANETTYQCDWHANMAHPFEVWTDSVAYDGSHCVGQPMIDPLFDSKSTVELLAMLVGESKTGMELVRGAFGDLAETDWFEAVHDGFVKGSASGATAVSQPVVPAGLDAAAWMAEDDSIEVVFTPSRLHDGRLANNAWIQEVPDSVTKVTWDNPAVVNPKTAKALGAKQNEKIKIEVDGRTVEAAVFIQPGQAENSIGIAIGYGRKKVGHIGGSIEKGIDPVGVDVGPLRTSEGWGMRNGVKATGTGSRYRLASTQDHHAIDPTGKAEIGSRWSRLIYEGTWESYEEFADTIIGGESKSEGAKSYSELKPDEEEKREHWPGHHHLHFENVDPIPREWKYSDEFKWGMSIDLNKCTGCNACVVACQAENNIGVVGKDEVARGRELHWIRIDRYMAANETYHNAGKILDDPEPRIRTQPVACHHCENAPCEQVCPVAATVHSDEGLNDMVYNRCIGTRYCGNNCPYKVRRFNYLNYSDAVTFVKYPWADKLSQDDISVKKLVNNPEVSIRSRGVMEKCSYCVQRIQNGKIKAKASGVPLGGDDITTACQDCCPTQAISFGNLGDKNSQVSKNHQDVRSYVLLEELNIGQRTKYMARVINPNMQWPVYVLGEDGEPTFLRYDQVFKEPSHHGAHGSHDGSGDHSEDGDHSKDGDHPKDGDDHSGDDHSKDGGEKHEKEELK